MARQTAFPGILVESIKARQPPFDDPGVIRDFGGMAVTREFPAVKKAADFTEDTVGDFLKSAEEMIGPLRDTFQIEYTLLVRSLTENRLSKRGAKARARAFTRTKNPFEPEVIEVRSATVDPDMTGREVAGKDLGTVYRVRTVVTK